jgi:hypothetical protein
MPDDDFKETNCFARQPNEICIEKNALARFQERWPSEEREGEAGRRCNRVSGSLNEPNRAVRA